MPRDVPMENEKNAKMARITPSSHFRLRFLAAISGPAVPAEYG